MTKKPGEAYDPSRKGKGGPYGPKVPGGGSNPFRTAKSNQNKRVASRVFGDKNSKGS